MSSPTTNPKATELVASVDSASPVAPSVEQYFEAAANGAEEFGESIVTGAGLSEDKKWLAEREVAALYLLALDGWLRKLAPGETFGGLMSDGFAYLGAGAVPEDKHDDERVLPEAAAAMEAVFRARVNDFGVLVLERPLSSSEALARAFALRLRAELGGLEAIEAQAAVAFHELPDLHAYEVARQFLDSLSDS